jgi:hypothetical protein
MLIIFNKRGGHQGFFGKRPASRATLVPQRHSTRKVAQVNGWRGGVDEIRIEPWKAALEIGGTFSKEKDFYGSAMVNN